MSRTTGGEAPLILTPRLDAAAFERLDGLRRRHFPPELNVIPAHLTLFHKLPGEALPEVVRVLDAAARGSRPMTLVMTGLRFLGRGVALVVEAPDLGRLRGRLAAAWGPLLSAQDRQGFRPHVTIQNKASPGEARALHRRLEADFVPFAATAEGLSLWRYRGGPWESVADFPFAAGEAAGDAPRPG